MFDNKLKKNLCKRTINKQLTQVVFSIDGIGTFQIYKVWLMALDDCIIWYDNNHKRFLFISMLKLVILEPVIKPVKKETMD